MLNQSILLWSFYFQMEHNHQLSSHTQQVHVVVFQFLPLHLRDSHTFQFFKILSKQYLLRWHLTYLAPVTTVGDVWQRLLDDGVPTTLWLQLSVSLYPGASGWHQNPAMMSWPAFPWANWALLHVTSGWQAFFPCDLHNHRDPITRRTSCPLCGALARLCLITL